MERRLAAILAADVVGYSRLMGADETGTLASLQACRAELIDPTIAAHNGRIVKLMGDGTLVEFASVVDAVACAAAIQQAMAARSAEVPEDRRLELRIGINLGDVIVEGDDIHGDGVNVARAWRRWPSRAGSVSPDRSMSRSGESWTWSSPIKACARSRTSPSRSRAYTVSQPASAAAAADDRSAPPLPDKPSIAVLPFENMSGDAEQEYFADGVTEDIITALSRVGWLFVIARNSAFAYKGQSADVRQVARDLGVRYVVEGSIRKAGQQVRISAQLIDGTSGSHVWAKRYDRELADIFALQDEITETVVGAIEPELGRAERRRAKAKRPDNLDAWDLYQRGMSALYQRTKDGLAEAQTLFGRAVELDPGLGAALAGSVDAYYYQVVLGLTDSLEDCQERALAAACRALELDDGDPAAHCAVGKARLIRREHDEAIPELETALELNPSFAWAHYGLGAALVFSNLAAQAVPHLETAIRLSPRDPHMGSFLVRMADAHLLMGRHEEAVQWARKSLRQTAFQWSRYAVLLSALGHLGRSQEAGQALDEILRHRPDFSLGFVRMTHLYGNHGGFKHYLDGLSKAGLPE